MNPIKESLQEIERKFTVKQVPENLEQYSHDDIKQGYYLDEEVNIEFRLRQKTEKFYKTYKIGSGLIREEFETEISKDDFENSWPLTKNKRLEKIRYYIPYGEHTIELDVYKGNLEGLKVAEVEFESEDDAVKFVAPDWFDQDVTEKEEYKNSNLAEKNTKEKPYSLEEGLEKLTSLVKEKLQEKDGTIIVEIAGGSSSGKTSAVSVKLKEMFGDDAMIFSMDDYYRGRTYMAIEAEKGNVLNFDQPEVLNLPLLKEHINQLKSGQSIQKPIYSFKEGEAVGTEELKPKRIIIVEGLFALNEQLIDEGDVKAFVDIGTHGRIMRRLLRDVERTGQRPEDILNYFSEVVEPMHDKYIQTTAKNADIIISNEYNPKIEADRANAEEIQVKYPLISVDYELIRKIGAERLSSSNQTDIYYNPKDKDLSTTGESLRIREESGRKILTYKGPKKDTSIRQRPKFEFQIDDDTESKFLDIYGDKVKVVNKQRDVYQYKSLVFTIDSVSDITDGKDRFIGSFVELRLQDVNPDNQIVNELIEKLSLNPEDAINKSYLEM
jgi:uridine kinase